MTHAHNTAHNPRTHPRRCPWPPAPPAAPPASSPPPPSRHPGFRGRSCGVATALDHPPPPWGERRRHQAAESAFGDAVAGAPQRRIILLRQGESAARGRL
uniref:Uncharacterized protein n=1 Tax=Oryza brachyantha TaxID=4533 RepID=J3ND19_ORYBR